MTLPNILLVICDDAAAGDFGFSGHPHVQTANLDALAAAGARARLSLAGGPWCPPSRVAIGSGRFPSPLGATFAAGVDHWRHGVSATLMSRLREIGYETGLFGKWHLEPKPPVPGLPSVRADFHHIQEIGATDRANSTRMIVDAALSWSAAVASPWFAWVALHQPHIPIRPTAEQLARYDGMAGLDGVREYLATITEIDIQIGRLLDANPGAIVVFTSDHGPQHPVDFAAGRALGRGWKGSLFLGGLGVPLIFAGPGIVPRLLDGVAGHVDICPTVLGMLGEMLGAPTDGIDLWPALRGVAEIPPRRMMWSTHKALQTIPYRAPASGRSLPFALLDGDLMIYGAGPGVDRWELFDVRRDPDQRRDLYGHHPDSARLAAELGYWIGSWYAGEPLPMPEAEGI